MPASHKDINEALTDIIRSHGYLDINAIVIILSMCRGRLETSTKPSRELSLAITKIQEAEMWLETKTKIENEPKDFGFMNPSFYDEPIG
jgi:hypothetical protein